MLRTGRIGVVALVAVLTLALTACDARGTVEVRSADEVVLDVTLGGITRRACRGIGDASPKVTVDLRAASGGSWECRVTGTISPADLLVLDVVAMDDYYVVTANVGGDIQPGAIDVILELPGRVLAASGGTVEGNTVRFTGDATDVFAGNVRVLAKAGPEVPWGPVGAAIGLLVGVLGTLVGLRWRRAARARATEAATELAPADADPVPDDAAVDTAEAFAPPAAVPDEAWARVAQDPAAEAPRPPRSPVDPTYWSHPPAAPAPAPGPAPEPPDPPTAGRPDTSMWAPPATRG